MAVARDTEQTAAEFARRFQHRSYADAVALCSADGRAALAGALPEGFGDESTSPLAFYFGRNVDESVVEDVVAWLRHRTP